MAENIVDIYYNTKTSLRDSIKTLRANIQFASLNGEIKIVALTSVVPSEGKTTISCFLGISMAEMGKKTVIVECDYRHPMIARNFGLEDSASASEQENDRNSINASLKKTSVDNLWVLDMKCKVKNPVELISSEAYAQMVQKLRQDFDFVILDTPPLGAFIDAAHVAALADGTVIVIRQGQVEKKAAKDVLAQLKKANANVIGAVLNNVKIKRAGYYYYNYNNYRYYYANRYYSQRGDSYENRSSDKKKRHRHSLGGRSSHHSHSTDKKS